MMKESAFLGVATVGAKGQIVIPAEARRAMKIEEGHKIVVVRGPREGSAVLFRVDSLEKFWEKATGGADREPG